MSSVWLPKQSRSHVAKYSNVKHKLRSFTIDMEHIHARAMTAMQLQWRSSPRYSSHAQTLSNVSLLLAMPGFWRPWYYFDSRNSVWRHIYVSFMTAITGQWQPCQSYDNHAGTMIAVPLLWQPCHHYDGRAKTMTAMSVATTAMSVLRQPCQCYDSHASAVTAIPVL